MIREKTDRDEVLPKYFLEINRIKQKPYPMVLAN